MSDAGRAARFQAAARRMSAIPDERRGRGTISDFAASQSPDGLAVAGSSLSPEWAAAAMATAVPTTMMAPPQGVRQNRVFLGAFASSFLGSSFFGPSFGGS